MTDQRIDFTGSNNSEIPLCGCGRMCRYYVANNEMACNMYFRCDTYEVMRENLIEARITIMELERERATGLLRDLTAIARELL